MAFRRLRSRSPHRTQEVHPWSLAMCARQPNKGNLQQEAHGIVQQHVSRVLGTSYRFEERGSLFSPYLQHVTDIDIQMFGRGYKIGAATAQALLGLRHSLFLKTLSVRLVSSHNGSTQEIPWSTFHADAQKMGECEAVVLCGIWRSKDGWLFPIDITASVGEDRETPDQRITKIQEKVGQGDYAKVLQKIRAMVRQPLKSSIASSVNDQIGPLRFLAKQLRMLRDHPEITNVKTYLGTKLGLRENLNPAVACLAVENEMQQRAQQELRRFKQPVAETLPFAQAQSFKSALRHI